MTQGRLIAVVGPSGVGKDSVMAGIKAALPQIHLVRRVITREPDLGGEDYDAVTVSEFRDMAEGGAFAVHWGAHDLLYGIPKSIEDILAAGTDCLANFSRAALAEAADRFDHFTVLNLTAEPDVLAARLSARGRETADDIKQRLSQRAKPLPDGLDLWELGNNGAIADTVARAVALIQPAKG